MCNNCNVHLYGIENAEILVGNECFEFKVAKNAPLILGPVSNEKINSTTQMIA